MPTTLTALARRCDTRCDTIYTVDGFLRTSKALGAEPECVLCVLSPSWSGRRGRHISMYACVNGGGSAPAPRLDKRTSQGYTIHLARPLPPFSGGPGVHCGSKDNVSCSVTGDSNRGFYWLLKSHLERHMIW